MSTLYIVATPIGNLEDITLRALRILKEVDLILCEDTRVTKRLLNKYGVVNKQLTTYNQRRSGVTIKKIIKVLEEGKDIALVSDAGTPTISDPGVMLVQQVKEKFGLSACLPEQGRSQSGTAQAGDEVAIVPIPGASALVAALSASGISSSEFTFLGFLPHKKGRETLFKEITESKRTVVFYESPHRILKTLASLTQHLDIVCPSVPSKQKSSLLDVGHPTKRKVVLARELTKIYEEFLSGTPEELKTILMEDPQKQKGEFVVIVSGK